MVHSEHLERVRPCHISFLFIGCNVFSHVYHSKGCHLPLPMLPLVSQRSHEEPSTKWTCSNLSTWYPFIFIIAYRYANTCSPYIYYQASIRPSTERFSCFCLKKNWESVCYETTNASPFKLQNFCLVVLFHELNF